MTLNIYDAIAAAGNGGVLRREGVFYDVREVVSEGNPPRYLLNDSPAHLFFQDSWEVVRKGPGPENILESRTVESFFEGVRVRDVVRNDNENYVYTGTFSRDDELKVSLVRVGDAHVRWLGSDELSDENSWEKAGPISDEYWGLYRMILLQNNQLHRHSKLIEEKNREIEDIRFDFARLNGFLNEYADDEDMCSEYEENLEEWSNHFRVMKLVGRERDWNVAVSINGSSRILYGPVKAVSAEAAARIVDDMSTREVIEKLLGDGDLYIETDEDETEVCRN